MEIEAVECKLITPMLMHGEDTTVAELRPPAIKGAMRFWWRAIHGNLPLDKLREQEAEIFGDTKRKSSFGIKIISSLDENEDTDIYKLLDYKEKIEVELNNKKNLDEKRKKSILRKYENTKAKGFKPNKTFEIEFFGKNIEKIKNIFLLSTILGGFGQRSRRGFGSIQIVGNEVLTSSNQIEELIKKINSNFDYYPKKPKEEQYPYIKSIKIGKKYDDFYTLLKQIGLATHKYSCFGSANPRQASPLIISIFIKNNSYYPVLTTLNGRGCWKNLQNFKGMIL